MGGILSPIFERNFGSVFGVHFCPFFGQFSIADLLVLRDFLAHESGFWPVFRRVLDRTFAPVFTFRGMACFRRTPSCWACLRCFMWLVDRSSTSIGAVNCSSQLGLTDFNVACFSICDYLRQGNLRPITHRILRVPRCIKS